MHWEVGIWNGVFGRIASLQPQQEGEATTNNKLKYETKKMKEEDKKLHRHVGGCSMAKEGDY